MARFDVDALIEQIARGEHPSSDDLAAASSGQDSVLRNLALVARISGFHQQLHEDPVEQDATLVQTRVETPTVRRWGSLEIQATLGRGGFGEVYRAYDPTLQRAVALKLFREDLAADPRAAESLLQEARLLARLRHENVVTVHGVENHEGRWGYWMELVEGKDLERHLRDEGPRSAEEASHVGGVLCRALAALHAAGLVHRDVKATNVMRERGGRLVLMDFGTVVSTQTSTNAPLSGTPAYMAPEVLRGATPTAAADIYGLGVLLFHLTTGAFPYEAKSLEQLKQQHATDGRRRLRDLRPDLPTGFCEVVERALDPDPTRRYASAGEFESALSASPPSATTTRRFPRRALGLALAALVVVAAGLAFLLPHPTSSPATLVVDARLFTLQDERPVAIGDGSSVEVGSPVWMEVRPSREAYVYVLNRDRAGQSYLLFPLPGYATQNPLAADVGHELPGRKEGARTAWQVSSEGNGEEILVVASATRLASFEESLASLPAAGEHAPPALALGPGQVDELVRGLGGTMNLPENASGSRADDVFAAAERLGTPSPAAAVWVRKITLDGR